jgi:adenine-specific DNA methylase
VDKLRNVTWALILVQRLCIIDGKKVTHISPPTRGDSATSVVRAGTKLPDALTQPIPDGIETSRLIRAGFNCWADLYPARQLEVLLAASRLLGAGDYPPAIRDRLALAVVGAAEMPGHLCRWDRFHPKVFESLANHRYSFDGLAIEPNPLSPLGRGSLTRRIEASVSAAKWLRENITERTDVGYLNRRSRTRVKPADSLTVVQGSSERQRLDEGTASLILTDPPYFDSVQYGELAGLFLTWMRATGLTTDAGEFSAAREAVPNRVRGTNATAYEEILTNIFGECARTLGKGGRLILTFHSTNLRAWAALGGALAENGFSIVGLSVARTENGSDHSKRGTRAFVTDLLIECTTTASRSPVKIVTPARTPEERELLHVGRAIAEAGGGGYEDVRNAFVRNSSKMRDRRIDAPITAGL